MSSKNACDFHTEREHRNQQSDQGNYDYFVKFTVDFCDFFVVHGLVPFVPKLYQKAVSASIKTGRKDFSVFSVDFRRIFDIFPKRKDAAIWPRLGISHTH